MGSPAQALAVQQRLIEEDKKRTTLNLPASLLDAAERMAMTQNTTISAIVSQALAAGLPALSRRDRAAQTYESLRSALAGELTEEERFLVDGVRLTPLEDLPAGERE